MMRQVYYLLGILVLLSSTYAVCAQTLEAPRRPNPMAMLKTGHPEAFIQFTQPKIAFGLALELPAGYEVETRKEKGFLGALPSEASKQPALYFKTDSEKITSATGTFFVSVQFFDEGQGALEIEYVMGEGEMAQRRRDRIFLGDSGFWQQHVFSLSNANLTHAMEGGTDFRLFCPNIPIRRVGISKLPPRQLLTQGETVSRQFYQDQVNVPANVWVGVSVGSSISQADWTSDGVLEEKARLYQSWGAPNLIDDIDLSKTPDNALHFNFSPYADRLDKCRALDVNWVPRFKIGHLPHLPSQYIKTLQRAMATQRNGQGPMLSLWEPESVNIYSRIFSEMRRDVNTLRVPAVVLSFAGDWGPLLLSSERGAWSGWPDLWAGDPIAKADFLETMHALYPSVNSLNAAWKTNYTNWSQVTPEWSEDNAPRRNLETLTWYRKQMTTLASHILMQAKNVFPSARIFIEVGDDAVYSAVDLQDFTALAASRGATLLFVTGDELPAESWQWRLFATSCRSRNAPFGLRFKGNVGGRSLMGGIYSLISDGGTSFVVTEDDLAQEGGWNIYADAMNHWRNGSPRPRIAVIAPRAALASGQALEFDRIIREMREGFAFDVIDEAGLSSVSSSEYPLVFVPWGEVWTKDGLVAMEQLVRSGSALLAYAVNPWQSLDGDRSINERLFAVKLERRGDEWVFLPRGSRVEPQNRNPYKITDRRVVKLGAPGDQQFISGKWGRPLQEGAYGLELPSFRWMGERGSIVLPIQPRKDYTLHVEGYIPSGNIIKVFLDREYFGDIEGKGVTHWSKDLSSDWKPRKPEMELMMRGQLWRTGEVLGATQSFRVSMAVSQAALLPRGESLENQESSQDDPRSLGFAREALRGSWMREVGQGTTIIAPAEYVSEWVFVNLIQSVVKDPSILDPRYQFTLPPDGQANRVLVSPQGGYNVYLNLNEEAKVVSNDTRRLTIPPLSIYYAN
ncbi:MAG: hypothetical protein P9L94_19745 [Candidatus Hinthialibacter antarcticus]|nr:hypothetical protein [Candidatus Hinthialibacter antarcticus]